MFRWQLILAWMCVLLINYSYGSLKRGQYNRFKNFCIPDEMYSGLPWDCTGYLQCKQTSSKHLDVFWFECPPGLYYSMRDRTCTWPQSTERNCPKVEEIIDQYCQINPIAVVPHLENCAQYYDCKDRTSLSSTVGYLKECKYPYLFSTDTMTCADFKQVECEVRKIPVSPCDYLSYSQCTGPNCPPCEESIPGCTRSPDGRNPYPERPMSRYFVECLAGKTIKVDTCAEGIFDPIKRACALNLDPKAVADYCLANPTHKIPHPGNCAHYYDCQQQTSRANYEKYEMECLYPKLFSSQQRICLPFQQVQCGTRYEPKAPCEYVADKCFGTDCPPCEEQNPSCITLPDGKNPYFGRENTVHYIVCDQERTKDILRCRNGHIFDPVRRDCVSGTTRPFPPIIGGGGTTRPFPPTPGGGGSGTTRPFPPTPGGGIIGGGTGGGSGGGTGGGTGGIIGGGIDIPVVVPPFPPTRPGIGLEAECRRNPMEVMVDVDNCARYFNCSQRQTFPGFKPYQGECPYPQLFSATRKICMDFPGVDCGSRFEPKAPCNYENTKRLCTGAMCKLTCEERSPSCVGLPNGNNTFPQRELTPFYMSCLRERTLSVGVCRYGIYDPTLKYCTTDLDESSVKSYCRRNPTKVFPHVANCARYYNCSALEVHPVFGMHQRECQAPYLFHIDLLMCARPQDVECRWRFEPKDPCNYLANQYCEVPNCGPCSDRFPSCAGLSDGRHSVPASDMDYVICTNGQFTGKSTCAPNLFDPLTKKCKTTPASLCLGLSDGHYPYGQSSTDYVVCVNGNLIRIQSCAPYLFNLLQRQCGTDLNCAGLADDYYPVPQSETDYFECRNGKFLRRTSCTPNVYDHSRRTCAVSANLCTGLSDGRHRVNDNDYEYIVCLNFVMAGKESCTPYIFDTQTKSCGQIISCSSLSDGNYAISSSLSDYYMCQGGKFAGIQSCSPYNFDTNTKQCKTSRACDGKQDGNYPVPGRDTDYYICRNGAVSNTSSCSPNKFDLVTRQCSNPCALWPDGNHLYNDDYEYVVCFNGLVVRIESCFPNMYDTQRRVCSTLRSCNTLVDGHYEIPGSTNTYYVCLGRNFQGIKSCGDFEYDRVRKECKNAQICANLADGNHPFPGKDTHYFTCEGGKMRNVKSCAPQTFDIATKKCSSIPNLCSGKGNGRYPIDGIDTDYVICLNNAIIRKGTCAPYIYDPDIQQCSILIKSCLEVPDGYYPLPSSVSDYYECFGGKYVGIQSCSPTEFDSITKNCKISQECDGKADGNHPVPGQDNGYYVCKSGVLSNTLSCSPNRFDPVMRKCSNPCDGLSDGNHLLKDDYQYVICAKGLVVSIESCFPNMFNTELKICHTIRSCMTLVDGRYEIPGSPNTYYACLGRNFQGIKSCGEFEYDPVKKECQNAQMCENLADGNHPFPGKDTDYYTCEAGKMSSMKSCAPQTFDIAAGKCASVPNLCIGSANGRHPMEGKDTDYIICLDSVLVRTESCVPYIYDSATGQCSAEIKSCQGLSDGKYAVPLSQTDYYECLGNHFMGITSCLPEIFDITSQLCRKAQRDRCFGMPDGKYEFPKSVKDYIICEGGTVRSVESCAPDVFDQASGNCIVKSSCQGKRDGNYPVQNSATDYIVCKNGKLSMTQSCSPGLFDFNTKQCQGQDSSACAKLPDGKHPYLGTRDRYIECHRGVLVRSETCSPYIYDVNLQVCATGLSCVGLQNGNNPYPGQVMNYIICKNGQIIDTASCAPDVYDSNARRCLFQPSCRDLANGNNAHPRNPMDFLVCRDGNLVSTQSCSFGFDSDKLACRSAPTCTGQGEGNHLLHGTDNYYFICSGGQLLDIAFCQGTIFNDVGRVCSTFPSCFGLADGHYPIPGKRSMYIRCNFGSAKEVKSCGRQVFNPIAQKCDTPSCAGLRDGKHSLAGSAYDYFVCLSNNLVEIKTCSPKLYHPLINECRDSPSCTGQPDGKYALFDSTADYIVCRGGSISEVGTCSPRKFDRELGICIDTGPSCYGLPDGINPHPTHPHQYITCENGALGKIESCPAGTYNRITRRCGRVPSCRDLPDGNNPDIDNMNNYLMCSAGALIGYISCSPDYYDPVLRLCSKTLNTSDPDTFCSQNPTAIIPHPDSCAQYIVCGNKNTEIGNYREECQYMQLFSTYTNSCRPYREVKCGVRPEPRAPCEYEKMNLCPSGSCPICATENPSCVGKRDGIQAFPSRLNYYIKCQDERTIDISKCPATSPLFDSVTGRCTFVLDPLKPAPYCEANPNEVIAHPDHCGQYIDCRVRNTALGNYRNECPYPDLWDTTTLACRDFNLVNCGTRKEPKSPCDFEQNMPCMDPENCIPCNDRMPSCIGLTDGKHPFHNRPDSYITCYRERTQRMEKCPSGIYDPEIRACISVFDPQTPNDYCSKKPLEKVANELNCATYFDCSKAKSTYGPYLQECEYPLLYDRNSKACRTFSVVRCGKRFEPMEPCEYMQNQQCYNLKAGDICKPCHERLPSCIGRPDGNNSFPGQENTKNFITCFRNRTVFVRECKDGYFDALEKKCVFSTTPTNPEAQCRINRVGRIAHPTNCHQYYDCTQENSPLGPFLQECDYPMGFNTVSNNCEFFASLQCGDRILPQIPCEYLRNQCLYRPNDVDCRSCESRLPSCVGLPDGNNTYPGEELTPKYITCMSNRTIRINQCEQGYFNPRRLMCLRRLRPGIIRDYCRLNPSTLIANPLNCAQYFDCGQESVRAGTYLRECPYPMYFDKLVNVCKNFTLVNCDYRLEIIAPCDYLQNKCNPRDQNCVPCERRIPSCVGLPDGNNPYLDRPMSAEFFRCYMGRTIGTDKCKGRTYFDRTTRQCMQLTDISDDMVREYCRVNVDAIFPHPRNCAQYYDCRQAIGGSYLRECRYPQMFDPSGICMNFSDVKCGERIEPVAPCDYLQNRCPQNTPDCAPCEMRLPSCRGQQEGNNPFPGRPRSEYYINCFKNRTVSVEACQVSRYDPVLRTCSPTIDQDLMNKYCRENPLGVVPDPLNCARYYNCSDPSVKQGIGVKFLSECKYPRLWNSSYLTASPTTGCVLFTDVQCNGRFEPKAPCEYIENQCLNGTCPSPCETQYPSCKDKLDGSNEFIGKEGSEFYTVCYKERTVAIVTCTIGVYSHNDRSCVGDSRPNAINGVNSVPP